MQVVEAHVRYTTRCCCLRNAQADPYSLQIDISTSFRHVFASPQPEIPTPPVKTCVYVSLRPHRSSNRNCPPKAHRGFVLGPALRVVSAPFDTCSVASVLQDASLINFLGCRVCQPFSHSTPAQLSTQQDYLIYRSRCSLASSRRSLSQRRLHRLASSCVVASPARRRVRKPTTSAQATSRQQTTPPTPRKRPWPPARTPRAASSLC